MYTEWELTLSSVGALSVAAAPTAEGAVDLDALDDFEGDDDSDDEVDASDDASDELEDSAISGQDKEETNITSVIKNDKFFIIESFSPLPLRKNSNTSGEISVLEMKKNGRLTINSNFDYQLLYQEICDKIRPIHLVD